MKRSFNSNASSSSSNKRRRGAGVGDLIGTPSAIVAVRPVAFVEARAADVRALSAATDILSRPSGGGRGGGGGGGGGGNRRVFQRLPRHLRRRAMSYNTRRVPRALRAAAAAEIAGAPPRAASSQTKRRRAQRRAVRRVTSSDGGASAAPASTLDERAPVVSERFARRQRDKRWLETHVWHARRFHMQRDATVVGDWGWTVPLAAADSGARAAWRAARAHAIMHDLSYAAPLELCGARGDVRRALRRLLDVDDARRVASSPVQAGARAAHGVVVHAPDAAPRAALGVATLLINAHAGTESALAAAARGASHTASGGDASAYGGGDDDDDDAAFVQAWICVHATAHDDTLGALRQVVDAHNAAAAPSLRLAVCSLASHVLCFEFSGARALSLIGAVLGACDPYEATSPARDATCAASSLLRRQMTRFRALLAGAARAVSGDIYPLVAVDPRMSWPPTSIHGERKEETASATTTTVTTQCSTASALFDAECRARWDFERDSQALIDAVRGARAPSARLRVATPSLLLVVDNDDDDGDDDADDYCRYRLFLSRGWGMPFWQSFVHAGARVVGVDERRELRADARRLSMPADAPDTPAAARAAAAAAAAAMAADAARPPAKRVNYAALRVVAPHAPDWHLALTGAPSPVSPAAPRVAVVTVAAGAAGTSSVTPLVLRDAQLLRRLRDAPATVDVASEVPSNALVAVVVVAARRGRVTHNAMICLDSGGDSDVIGFITSTGHGFSLTRGQGEGIGFVAARQWLAAAAAASHGDYSRVLLRSPRSATSFEAKLLVLLNKK